MSVGLAFEKLATYLPIEVSLIVALVGYFGPTAYALAYLGSFGITFDVSYKTAVGLLISNTMRLGHIWPISVPILTFGPILLVAAGVFIICRPWTRKLLRKATPKIGAYRWWGLSIIFSAILAFAVYHFRLFGDSSEVGGILILIAALALSIRFFRCEAPEAKYGSIAEPFLLSVAIVLLVAAPKGFSDAIEVRDRLDKYAAVTLEGGERLIGTVVFSSDRVTCTYEPKTEQEFPYVACEYDVRSVKYLQTDP